MYTVTRQFHFCYAHRLPDYDGCCRNLHGHNAKCEVTVASPGLDAGGMVLDFGEIRGSIERWVDENLDHRTILWRDDPLLPVLAGVDVLLFVMDEIPTAENLARLIYEQAKEIGLAVVEVRVWETKSNVASYAPRG